MQGNDLFEDMGYVDDDLVEGALKAKASSGWRAPSRWLAAAACLAVAALVGWSVWSAVKPVPAQPEPEPVTEEAETEKEPVEEPIEIEVEQPEISVEPEVAEIEPQPISETSSAFAPIITEPDAEAYPTQTMIESYPGDGTEADYAVNNGQVGYSLPLSDAMAEYGDTVLYRVYVEIFKNGVQLAPEDPEVLELLTSLLEDGIISAYESVYQDGNFVVAYPTLHATYDQLQQFQGDPNHGWMLFLYAERVN